MVDVVTFFGKMFTPNLITKKNVSTVMSFMIIYKLSKK